MLADFPDLVKELGALLGQLLATSMLQIPNEHAVLRFIRHGLILLRSWFMAALAGRL